MMARGFALGPALRLRLVVAALGLTISVVSAAALSMGAAHHG